MYVLMMCATHNYPYSDNNDVNTTKENNDNDITNLQNKIKKRKRKLPKHLTLAELYFQTNAGAKIHNDTDADWLCYVYFCGWSARHDCCVHERNIRLFADNAVAEESSLNCDEQLQLKNNNLVLKWTPRRKRGRPRKLLKEDEKRVQIRIKGFVKNSYSKMLIATKSSFLKTARSVSKIKRCRAKKKKIIDDDMMMLYHGNKFRTIFGIVSTDTDVDLSPTSPEIHIIREVLIQDRYEIVNNGKLSDTPLSYSVMYTLINFVEWIEEKNINERLLSGVICNDPNSVINC